MFIGIQDEDLTHYMYLITSFPIIRTDEHGLKVLKASVKENTNPLNYCNIISQQFKTLFDKYSVNYTDYIRTTEERHSAAVSKFFETLEAQGCIYKSEYEGWYCSTEESFITAKETKTIVKDGKEITVNATNDQPVEWSSEVNYLFKLKDFQSELLYWLRKKDRVVPRRFQEELTTWISNGLHDLSISRPRLRVPWGIQVPGDKDQTIYVWLDALVNYLTVSGYPELRCWPPNLQVIGKDILRFHGIYWPALLMAANLEPPEKLLVHCHLMVNDMKMSKSLGNVVCPISLLDNFSPDSVRYVLLRMNTFHSDGAWCDETAAQCANSELANTLGNLLNRCTAPSLNPQQEMPVLDDEYLATSSSTCRKLLSEIERLSDEVETHFANFHFNVGIDVIMNMVRTANLFIEEEKPWKLKDNPDRRNIDSILFIGLLTIRSAAICLQPIVPDYASKLLNMLNIPLDRRKKRFNMTESNVISSGYHSSWRRNIPRIHKRVGASKYA
ncbi:Methionine--tRNA ligase, mitochondrial [Armadillidium vulgare]|nr:Methionine--tRNA ligase, mitochondrial [Armadillidium vulgare]